jgi:GMP synthase (glutamine-hydrolysing)
MKKPILLIQFRKNPTLEHEQECIIKSMDLRPDELLSVNIPDSAIDHRFNINNYRAIIIGGSSEYNISNWSDQLNKKAFALKPFFQSTIENDFPLLGICFGHQLLSYLFGGEVVKDDKQAEGGIVEVELSKEGQKANIFTDIPQKFPIVSGHKDSVTKIPNDWVVLARSKKTTIHACKIKSHIYSVQFHPELDTDGLVNRLTLFPEYTQGRSMEEIRSEFVDLPYGKIILQNFKKLIL